MSFEVNFDGLVGPTHNYAGLSPGNVASMTHRGVIANPREAALQGLAKMRSLHELGLRQAFLPPLERPSVEALRRFGFTGTPEEVLAAAGRDAPELLRTACSASAMWTANAATVSPAQDTTDGRTHFTPANLICNVHRSLEPAETGENLRRVFPEGEHFAHHLLIGGGPNLGDEGAANHTRLAPRHADKGLHVFVFGASAYRSELPRPRRYVARQSLEASECIARLNQLDVKRCLYLQQNPDAIDAGVFHNDVIATGNERVYLYHEQAYVDSTRVIAALRDCYASVTGEELVTVEVPAARVSLEEAVRTYLFNSQLVTLPAGGMALIAPEECRESEAVEPYIRDMVADPSNPVSEVRYFNLRASMSNGGGPACLRLRVVLDDAAWAAVPDGVKIDAEQLTRLEDWVRRHYREELTGADLADPALLSESRTALDELAGLMGLPGLYAFQR